LVSRAREEERGIDEGHEAQGVEDGKKYGGKGWGKGVANDVLKKGKFVKDGAARREKSVDKWRM